MIYKEIVKHQKGFVNYSNVIAFEKYGLCYIAIPKAANTSIKYWLYNLTSKKVGERLCLSNIHDKSHNIFNYKNTSWVYKNKNRMFTFSIVRHPLNRLYSAYIDKTQGKVMHQPFIRMGFKKDMSFEEFVLHCCGIPDKKSDVHIRSQMSMLMLQGCFLPNLVLKLENLERDFQILKNIIECQSSIKLDQLTVKNNKTNGKVIPKISKTTLEKVKSRYLRDFRFFNYE